MSTAHDCGPLPPGKQQNVLHSSERGNETRTSPAVQHIGPPFGLAALDHVHILLHPADDVVISVPSGKTENPTVAHFADGRMPDHALVLVHHVRDESLRVDEDAISGDRDREIDICGGELVANPLVRYFQPFHPRHPWTEGSIQLCDGAGLEQVVGYAEGVLQVVDVCYFVARLLADEHQCVLKLQAMTMLAIFGVVVSNMDRDFDVLKDSLAVDLISQFTRKPAKK
jgi:hypothetical protein